MDIYLTSLETDRRICLPQLPESVQLQTGAQFHDFSIMAVGTVKIPNGEELDGVSWSGVFPGAARRFDPHIAEWASPQDIIATLDAWKSNGEKLRLLATETPINHDMYIQSFQVEAVGGYGDFKYEIELVQAKQLILNRSGTVAAPAAPRPAPPPPATHTVRESDSLWHVAQRHYGCVTQHQRIYDANRDAIEAQALRCGHRSSENGRRLMPGTVLQMPS